MKYTTTFATPTLPQHAIAELLASGGYDHHLRRLRQTHACYVEAMRQAVKRFFPEDTRVTWPAGGFVLWIRLPDGVDSLVLYRQALREGIAITPGYIPSATEKYRDFIRLNAANWSDQAERAVEKLGRLVADARDKAGRP